MDNTKAVAVFMYDGSEKYSSMTLNAIKSFLATTKSVNVGLLVSATLAQPDWTSHFGAENKSRLDVRTYQDHFTNWNPTQYKLDIQKFADKYEIVLWVDSDTVFFNDLGTFIGEFATSQCTVALVEDLVTSKTGFQQRWAKATGSTNLHPFVPQTALMAFKRTAFARVFPVWEATWRKWIEPAPFANYGDPDPAFPGSTFCIEQYALGLALELAGALTDGSLFNIPRRQVLFKDTPAGGGQVGSVFQVPFSALVSGVANGVSSSSGGSYQLGSYSLGSHQLGSYQLGSSQLGSYQLGSYQLGSQQVGSYALSGSLAAALGSYQLGSYQLGSYQLGSYQLGSYQLGSSQLGSSQLGSYQLGSYQGGSYQGVTPPSGSYAFDQSLQVNEAMTHSGLVGVVPVASGLKHDIVVDSFAGSVLHFYSFNYQSGIGIYNEHPEQVKGSLQELWKK